MASSMAATFVEPYCPVSLIVNQLLDYITMFRIADGWTGDRFHLRRATFGQRDELKDFCREAFSEILSNSRYDIPVAGGDKKALFGSTAILTILRIT